MSTISDFFNEKMLQWKYVFGMEIRIGKGLGGQKCLWREKNVSLGEKNYKGTGFLYSLGSKNSAIGMKM